MFFEGIEARISAGVKAEEVGYQLDYSKQELRRIIKEYPSKEVWLCLYMKSVIRLLCSVSDLYC